MTIILTSTEATKPLAEYYRRLFDNSDMPSGCGSENDSEDNGLTVVIRDPVNNRFNLMQAVTIAQTLTQITPTQPVSSKIVAIKSLREYAKNCGLELGLADTKQFVELWQPS